MRLEFQDSKESGWTTVAASPVESDGYPPLPELRIDWPLHKANEDRNAVGLSLIYSPWMAGRTDFSGQLSPLTEQRIVEWFQSQGVWIAPGPVRVGGVQIPRGRKTASLDGEDPVDSQAVSIVAVDSMAGSASRFGEYRIATNFGILANNAPSAEHRFYMEVGFAVLVAESIDVSLLTHRAFFRANTVAFNRVARLLECVSLGLNGG